MEKFDIEKFILDKLDTESCIYDEDLGYTNEIAFHAFRDYTEKFDYMDLKSVLIDGWITLEYVDIEIQEKPFVYMTLNGQGMITGIWRTKDFYEHYKQK